MKTKTKRAIHKRSKIQILKLLKRSKLKGNKLSGDIEEALELSATFSVEVQLNRKLEELST